MPDLARFTDLLPAAIVGALFAGVLALMLGMLARRSAARARRREFEVMQQVATAESVACHMRQELDAARIERLEGELRRREARIDQLQQSLAREQNEHAALRARQQEQQRAAAEKMHLLEQARAQLSVEFTALANRIFQEKTDRFARESKTTLDLTLTPLREQLAEFRRRVDEVYTGDSEGRVKLLHEIGALKELNRQMSDEALNLTRALKGDSKMQGGWGEVILERVLEESGLHKGREYDTQVTIRDAEGQRRIPDVIVRLPEGRDVVIDAKVSLRDYERYCSATDEDLRSAALRAHVGALRNHIETLSVKDYQDLEGLRTLDFVLVFVPIEAAFITALEQEPALFRRAYDRNIIMVSPTTLLATLRTVQSIWRYERQSRNAEEIARGAGALHDQFARVLESLDDLGRHLARTQGAFEQTLDRLARGRGNLVSRVVKLEKLGARTRKQLPAQILAIAHLDEDADDDSVDLDEP
ncbi:MAG: DNA recombination protein RmuC [Gammaproteobacteria bacterium]|nr:DNA recombination protein RmuC [Gammaproteobacteria bacterium]